MAEDQKKWFQKTEARLYAYPALIARHRKTIAENNMLPTLKATRYTPTSWIRGSDNISEAERFVLKHEKISQIVLFLEEKLQEELYKMTALFEILSTEEQKYVLMKYFEQRPRQIIADKLERSIPTCDKIRYKVIAKGAYVYGFLDYDEYMELLTG